MKIDMSIENWKKLYLIMSAVSRCNFFTSDEHTFARAFMDSFDDYIWVEPMRHHE